MCQGPRGDSSFFFRQACNHSMDKDLDKCLGDLTKAIELNSLYREQAREYDALEWARSHMEVSKILGLASGAKQPGV